MLCLPIVGIVVTISPNFNLYNIVVLPAASRPTIKILMSRLPKRFANKLANMLPIVFDVDCFYILYINKKFSLLRITIKFLKLKFEFQKKKLRINCLCKYIYLYIFILVFYFSVGVCAYVFIFCVGSLK